MAKIRIKQKADGTAVFRLPASTSWVNLPANFPTGLPITDKRAVKDAFRQMGNQVQLVPVSARKEVSELAKEERKWTLEK